MECELCQTPGRKKFYCEVCLNERLLIHRNALQRLRASLETRVQNATENLQAPGGVRERRHLKAKRDALITNIRYVESKQKSSFEQLSLNKTTLLDKRRELTNRQTRLQAARDRLLAQRSTLQKPNYSSSNPHSRSSSPSNVIQNQNQISANLEQKIASIHRDWDQILENLAIVRKKLLVQLCGIYTITANYTTNQSVNNSVNPTPIQQQPPRYREGSPSKVSSVDKINPRLSWRILGLCLPVSTEIKSYHHEQISAATLYTAHLVRLIAMYLGIKLPFQMIMGPFLSIRAPPKSIWSNKHPSPYPLHIPNSTVCTSGSQVSQVAYLSGLCMLAINVHYLLLTQQPGELMNPEENATTNEDKEEKLLDWKKTRLTGSEKDDNSFNPTELLKNLYTLCCIRPIGLNSHLTGKNPLCRPDHPNNSLLFLLDHLIHRVLQSKIIDDNSVDDGWSII